MLLTSTCDGSRWEMHRDYDADGALCDHVWHAPADWVHTPHRTVQASLTPFGMFAECSCDAKLCTSSAPRYSPPPPGAEQGASEEKEEYEHWVIVVDRETGIATTVGLLGDPAELKTGWTNGLKELIVVGRWKRV